MKYIIDVPEDRVHGDTLCALGIMEDGMDHYLPTGIKAVPYDESKAEKRGQEEAWELAEKIAFNQGNIREILLPNQPDNICRVFDKFSYAEAREKCDSWKGQEDEIHVGDEVECNGIKGVVCLIGKDEVCGICPDMWTEETIITFRWDKSKILKTDRSFPELAEVFEKMKENE